MFNSSDWFWLLGNFFLQRDDKGFHARVHRSYYTCTSTTHFPHCINSPVLLLCVNTQMCRSCQQFPEVVLNGILWYSGQPVCWGMASERVFSCQNFRHLWRRLEMQKGLPATKSGEGFWVTSARVRDTLDTSAGHRNVSPIWPEYQWLWVVSFQQKASLPKEEIGHLLLYQVNELLFA